jgi:single-strand DNA-binding protein
LAVNKRRKSADGNWADEVNYFNCVYFLGSSAGITQYLTKGQQVSVAGELHQNVWEQNGQKRYDVEIYVNGLSLLSSSRTSAGNNGPGNQFQGRNDQFRNNGYGNQGSQGNNVRQVPNGQAGGYQQNAQATPPAQQSAPSMGDMDDLGLGPEGFDDEIPF